MFVRKFFHQEQIKNKTLSNEWKMQNQDEVTDKADYLIEFWTVLFIRNLIKFLTFSLLLILFFLMQSNLIQLHLVVSIYIYMSLQYFKRIIKEFKRTDDNKRTNESIYYNQSRILNASYVLSWSKASIIIYFKI